MKQAGPGDVEDQGLQGERRNRSDENGAQQFLRDALRPVGSDQRTSERRASEDDGQPPFDGSMPGEYARRDQ